MNNTEINEIKVNGIDYVRKDSVSLPKLDAINAVIVRTTAAGVFFGTLAETNLKEGWVKMKNARRIWYWVGAASLSQLATDGTSQPKDCKFPTSVAEVTLLGVIEIIPCTETAVKSISGVSVWKQ